MDWCDVTLFTFFIWKLILRYSCYQLSLKGKAFVILELSTTQKTTLLLRYQFYYCVGVPIFVRGYVFLEPYHNLMDVFFSYCFFHSLLIGQNHLTKEVFCTSQYGRCKVWGVMCNQRCWLSLPTTFVYHFNFCFPTSCLFQK